MADENTQKDKKIDPKNRQLTLEEYRALQVKNSKRFKGIELPFIAKVILSIPLIIIALAGLFILPMLAIKGCDGTPEPVENVNE